jgi:hypothetical protein
MVNPGGLEPPAAGLKVPCPADPGFTLGVRSDPAFERRHVLLHWFHQVWCKPVESNHLPLGYRPRPSPFGLACEAEDCRLNWYPFRDSNPGSRFVGPTLWAAKLKGCGAPSRIRTCTELFLRELPPAGWAIGAFPMKTWCSVHGFEPATCPLQGGCSAN